MSLVIKFQDDELNDLRILLNRALNTWDKPPKWAMELSDLVDKKLDALEPPYQSDLQAAFDGLVQKPQ